MTSDQQIDAFLDRWADLMPTVERANMQVDLILLVSQADHEGYMRCSQKLIERIELGE